MAPREVKIPPAPVHFGRASRVENPTSRDEATERMLRWLHGLCDCSCACGRVCHVRPWNETPSRLIPIVQTNSVSSPLLRLPAEIRSLIFEYALGGCKLTVRPCLPRRDPLNGEWIKSKPIVHQNDIRDLHTNGFLLWSFDNRFALTRVCRQLYSETATLPYSHNVFSVSRLCFKLWRDGLRPAQRDAITTLDVTDQSVKDLAESSFPGLKKVIVRKGFSLRHRDPFQPISERSKRVARRKIAAAFGETVKVEFVPWKE